MLVNENVLTALNSSVRTVEGRVYVYGADNSTIATMRHSDYLKSFTVERVGEEGKFFGFGVCQKCNVKIIDKDRSFSFSTANQVRPIYIDRSTGAGVSIFTYPNFNITEINRDENTNELSITAYDALYRAAAHTVSELNLQGLYTIHNFIKSCVDVLNLKGASFINIPDDDIAFKTIYEDGANFEGTETIRDALDAAAEATQSIYYISNENKIVFKRLNKDGEAVFNIDKEKYFSLESKTNKRLATITHTTELGDNVSVSTNQSGTTQYIRNNPFWELREDIDTLLESALNIVGNLTINQFDCSWRGNYLLEIGDKIGLTTKDDDTVISYILNDTSTYDGSLSENTQWSYTDSDNDCDSNSTNLGEILKQTYARVDKANKEIELLVSQQEENSKMVSSLKQNSDSIVASVEKIQKGVTESLDNVSDDIQALTKKVEATVTPESVKLLINSAIEKGVEKVETSTGFSFDEKGLTVDKSDSEMKTTITEDGMTVYKNEEAVLTANNSGVEAVNLSAKTYLIIGNNSRLEDYGTERTGCFWIGN